MLVLIAYVARVSDLIDSHDSFADTVGESNQFKLLA